MTKSTSVFVFGTAGTVYRPALVLKYFLDRPRLFEVTMMASSAQRPSKKPLTILCKLLMGTLGVLRSDVLYILPMSHYGLYSTFFIKLAVLMRRRVITDLYVSAYETNVIDRKSTSCNSKYARRLWEMDRLCFKKSAPGIHLNNAELNYYCEILDIRVDANLKSAVIPLVVPSRPKANLPYLNGISRVPTIAWWGREGNPLHGFETIAAALRILIASEFPCRIAVFGSGGTGWPEVVSTHADLVSNQNVIFTDAHTFTNGKLTAFLMEEVDLAIGTFGATHKAKTVITNKVLDAASFGIPCLTQYSGGMSEYFITGDSIAFCEEDPHLIAETIQKLLLNKDGLLRMGANAQKIVHDSFSPEAFEKKLGALFE